MKNIGHRYYTHMDKNSTSFVLTLSQLVAYSPENGIRCVVFTAACCICPSFASERGHVCPGRPTSSTFVGTFSTVPHTPTKLPIVVSHDMPEGASGLTPPSPLALTRQQSRHRKNMIHTCSLPMQTTYCRLLFRNALAWLGQLLLICKLTPIHSLNDFVFC